ncbi:hypothetical protein, variant 1 [Aphanomyces invadans]|uniref:Uncharacterized protein n=1 Tax=Aphanomyces invadans TaxID=157072 RepID=A0A024UPM9_9STRA|nr:hypothetical protein, variant 1 [Aphanomyces invadans]ETW08254.1 hypothetical protein, variant 1 [Aphanomyces invadans]|eukprot:XP_008862059.1 hypothetical protein, variant 1 [Aphanomyces invadans]
MKTGAKRDGNVKVTRRPLKRMRSKGAVKDASTQWRRQHSKQSAMVTAHQPETKFRHDRSKAAQTMRPSSKQQRPKKENVDLSNCKSKTAALTQCTIGWRERYCIMRMNKAAKSKTLLVANVKVANVVVQAVPPGTDRLEFSHFQRVEMHDIVLPTGITTISFSRGIVGAYPSPTFRNITLPPTVKEVSFRCVKMELFNPTEWAAVPMETMGLHNNMLDSFVNVTFPPSVQYLDLSKNKLTAFVNTTLPVNLQSLRLSSNKFHTLDAIPLHDLPHLTRLIVSDNPLGTVDASTVLPSSLIDLDLSKCSLTRIDRAFRYPERLRKLDLSDNNMTSFVPDLLPISLSELKLAGNPLDDFVIRDRAMLKQLRQMKTLDATTTNVMCNSTAYRKVVVQGQVFACMLKAMAESTTMLNANGNMAGKEDSTLSTVTVVLVVACASSVVVLIGVVVMLRHQQNQRWLSPIADKEKGRERR